MAQYKDQHYLPTCYLKYFSDDQVACGPYIWRFGGRENHRIPLESQCAKKYFYSRQYAVEIERHFGKFEGFYSTFITQIRSGQVPPPVSFGDLFFFMVDLSLRNGIHKNHTGKEGLDAYEMRLNWFWSSIFLGNPSEFSMKDVVAHTKSNWRLEIITAPNDIEFTTSDNPSILGSRGEIVNGRPRLELVLTPLDPHHIAVAFDQRFISGIHNRVKVNEVQLLNSLQIHNAGNSLYQSSEFKESDVLILRHAFTTKTKPASEVTNEGWQSFMQKIRPELFSFILYKTPLI